MGLATPDILGVFHTISPDERIGRRTGIIAERLNGMTYAVHLLIRLCGRKKRLFQFDFDRQEQMDIPVWWVRVSWDYPPPFPERVRQLRVSHLLGSMSFSYGVIALHAL